MSTQGQQAQTASPVYRTERVIASLVMAWVIILTTYMIFQDHALSHTSMYFLKIILSLSGAVMLATLPGFMDVNYSIGGFSVRAAGGAAAFVFIYTQSPNLPALKLDPAQARPAPQQALPKSDNLSSLTSGFPTLMAFSLVPPGLLYSSAPANNAAADSGGFESAVYMEASGGSELAAVAGLRAISIAEAVSTDAVAVLAAVADYARVALRQLRVLLDTAAAALRSGVSHVASAIGDLLGALKTLGAAPHEAIALITENLSARTDDLVSGLFGPDGPSAGALFDRVGGLTTGWLGGVQDSADGLVSTLDGTVQGVTTLLQGSVHTVLDTTEKVAHGVTDLIDGATGGLTSGLTPVANRIVSGIASTTGRVVDGITPAVADTASQVLDGVGGGVGKLTAGLNAVSPALISTIDPDFASGHALPQLPDTFAAPAPLLGKLGANGGHGLLGATAERDLFANKFADPLGGEALPLGQTCIGGCGGKLLSGVRGPLSETLGGLGNGQSRLLGPLGGGGPASAGHASGGSIAGGPPVGPGGGQAGPISSVSGNTRSLLGGATQLLGRR